MRPAKRQKVQITGMDQLKTYIDTATEYKPVSRQFCGNCGTNILALTESNDAVRIVAAGTLDDYARWRPAKEVYCAYRAEWLDKAKGVETRYMGNANSEEEK
ncbi:hypothetical protein MBLNU230_g1317t1 [Neophaeotheca triangularis]